MLSETYLVNLNISSNYITDDMGVKIAEQMTKNRCLETLNLSVNTLTEESGVAFKEGLRDHPCMSKLDLSQNFVPIRLTKAINDLCASKNEHDPKDTKIQTQRLKRENKQLHESIMSI